MKGHKFDHVFSDTKYKVYISHTELKKYIITKQITTIQHTWHLKKTYIKRFKTFNNCTKMISSLYVWCWDRQKLP